MAETLVIARRLKYITALPSKGVDVTQDVDPNANEHHRSVVAVKKKALFAQDTPALSYLEDGNWEDSQLYAAWAAKYDPEVLSNSPLGSLYTQLGAPRSQH